MESTILSKLENQEGLGNIEEELKNIMLNEGVVWGSGLNSNNEVYKWVIDTKAFLLNPRGLYLTTRLFLDKIKKYNADAVGGLTLASHLIASSLVYSSDGSYKRIDGFLVRRERKKYDMLKLIEGPDISGKNVIVVDDVLNNAGFATKAIETVEAIGCKVMAVIVLINCENQEFEELKNKGYTIESIYTLKEFGLDARCKPLNFSMFELKWRFGGVNTAQFAIPKSSPIIDNERIYVGSDLGKMLCLDFSGKLLWEFKADYHPEGVHSTPIIVKNKVIFGGYDGSVYAIDKNDGFLIWKNKTSSYVGASPIYDSETNLVYIGLENNTLIGTMAAINVENGDIEWELTTNSHVPCRAAIEKDVIVFGSNDCFIYACNKRDGKLLWKFRAYGEVKGRLTIDNGLCYATSLDGFIYCIELSSGKLVWKKKLGTSLYNEPIICNSKVIIGSYSNQLTALDKKNGKVLWYFMTNDIIQSYPSYYNGVVYFGSYDGCIYAVDAKNGNLLWKFITAGPVNSSPTPYKNKLFVSSNDGYLYCFERKQ